MDSMIGSTPNSSLLESALNHSMHTSNQRFFAMRLHGTCMIIAWFILLPIAATLARYFRSELSVAIFRVAMWFQSHRALAIVGVILVLYSAIGTLVDSPGWSNYDEVTYVHSVIGVLVIVGVIVQPLLTIFRCKPTHSKRFIFNWFHRIFGFLLLLIAQIDIFLTTYMLSTGLAPAETFGHAPRTLIVSYWIFGLVVVGLLESTHQNVWFKFRKAFRTNEEPDGFAEKMAILKVTLLILFISLSILIGGILTFCLFRTNVLMDV